MSQSSSVPPGHPPAPVSVEEIERRIRWPALPAILFVGIMIGLGIVALVGVRREPPILSGLPDDADVRAAVEAARDVRFDPGPLRFECALFGGEPSRGNVRAWSAGRERASFASTQAAHSEGVHGWQPRFTSSADSPAVARAAQSLARAEERYPRDARIRAALAALDLASGSLERAEGRYRGVVDREPGYGEARLGLGVTLALIGARAASEREQRRWILQAIAQFAAVRENDPMHEAALHDRVAMLERVGRHDEAGRFAAQLRALYPDREAPAAKEAR